MLDGPLGLQDLICIREFGEVDVTAAEHEARLSKKAMHPLAVAHLAKETADLSSGETTHCIRLPVASTVTSPFSHSTSDAGRGIVAACFYSVDRCGRLCAWKCPLAAARSGILWECIPGSYQVL
jgi:hypothetical protein